MDDVNKSSRAHTFLFFFLVFEHDEHYECYCHQSSQSSSCQDKDAMIIIIVMRAAIDGQPFQLPYHAFK